MLNKLKMINENIIKKNSNSLLTDIKMISNVLKCKMEEVGKSKLKDKQLNRIEEIYSKTNEVLERVKFCLDNIKDKEIKEILIFLTNSFERKIKQIENIEIIVNLETDN
jgi:hypothetical protein